MQLPDGDGYGYGYGHVGANGLGGGFLFGNAAGNGSGYGGYYYIRGRGPLVRSNDDYDPLNSYPYEAIIHD